MMMSRNRNRTAARACAWITWLSVLMGWTLLAQTQVDLSRQSRAVDLSAVGPTKPMQTGTVLPGQCSVGELFFKTDAIPGQNIYACASTDSWVVSSGAGGGTGGITTNGGAIGGHLMVFLDDTGANVVDSGVAGSPANFLNPFAYQAGTPLDCVGQGGDTGSAMNCMLTPTLSAYALHMPLRLTPQVANAGPFTLDIDSIGPLAVKQSDCSSDPEAGYYQPGQTYFLVYNGSLFCEAHAGGQALQPAAPYERIQSSSFLPYGYPAELPPTTGWTGVNFTGATFVTSGLGGALKITTPGTRTGESLSMQTRPIGSNTALEAVLGSAGLGAATDFAACGIGVENDTSTAAYVIFQQMEAAAGPLREAGYSSPLAQAFLGNTAVSGVGNVVYLRIDLSGSDVVTSYSPTGGPGSWVEINTRTLGAGGMPASVDNWAFLGEASGSSPATCQLLSWKVQ